MRVHEDSASTLSAQHSALTHMTMQRAKARTENSGISSYKYRSCTVIFMLCICRVAAMVTRSDTKELSRHGFARRTRLDMEAI